MVKVAFSFLCGLVGAFAATTELGWRIVGGEDAAEGQFPYQISLRDYGSHTCGGSILDETTILCAAHCVYFRDPLTLTVVAGTNYLSSGGNIHQVLYYEIHEKYDALRTINDIAILKLATPLVFGSTIKPIKLPSSNIEAGEDVTLSGWGRTSYPGNMPENLQFIKLKTLDRSTCQKMQGSWQIFESQVCTLTKAGEGACHGDSGGPLVDSNGAQIGIVSWGSPCARGFPDVFTRVYSFLDWIESNRH